MAFDFGSFRVPLVQDSRLSSLPPSLKQEKKRGRTQPSFEKFFEKIFPPHFLIIMNAEIPLPLTTLQMKK